MPSCALPSQSPSTSRVASLYLVRAGLVDEARQPERALVERHEERGSWILQSMCERSILPGLLEGISGILGSSTGVLLPV